MNWIEIDRVLRNMVSIYKDRAKLYADVKKKFAWNNNQAKAALDPIVNKMDAVVVEPVKPKRKRRTKAEMEASRKKAPVKAKKLPKKAKKGKK